MRNQCKMKIYKGNFVCINCLVMQSAILEFFLNVFTEFSEFSDKNIFH